MRHRGPQRAGLLDALRGRNDDRRRHRPAAAHALLRPLRQERRLVGFAAPVPLRPAEPAAPRRLLGHRRAGGHRPRNGEAGRGFRMRRALHLYFGRRAPRRVPRPAARGAARMGRRGLDTRPAEPRDRRADRRGRTAAHEAHGRTRQRGPRRHRRRSGPGRGAGLRHDRQRGARRVRRRTARGRQSAAASARPGPAARLAAQRMVAARGRRNAGRRHRAESRPSKLCGAGQ